MLEVRFSVTGVLDPGDSDTAFWLAETVYAGADTVTVVVLVEDAKPGSAGLKLALIVSVPAVKPFRAETATLESVATPLEVAADPNVAVPILKVTDP